MGVSYSPQLEVGEGCRGRKRNQTTTIPSLKTGSRLWLFLAIQWGLGAGLCLRKNLFQNLVIEETEEHSWAHACPTRLAAMSTIWAELKQAHHRDLSVVQPFLPSLCSQARNRLSTSPQQCGVRIWFCCALFQPVGASRVSDQQLPSSILARVWPDEQTAPPSLRAEFWRGQQTGLFQVSAATLASLPLFVPLALPESLPAAQLLEGVEVTFGCFPLALKDSSSLLFPQSQQNTENGLHGKREKWFLC